MDDLRVKSKLTDVNLEIEQRKKQLKELRLNYQLARERLSFVEKQLQTLEEQYDLLAQGQLPLDLHVAEQDGYG